MLRKGVFVNIIAIALLTAILLSPAQVALANRPLIKVNVHARAYDGNIIVIGKVFLHGLESEGKVGIMITLRRPDGTSMSAEFIITVVDDGSGVTILPYSYVFEDCINEKGIYEVEVVAIYNGLMDTAYFKFDPPTGGTPGVPC